MINYVYLTIAIVGEVIATSALKASEGFTRLWPSLLVVAGYGVAFFFLSLVLHAIPVGIAYAIWSGVGIVLVTIVGAVLYGQVPDLPAIIGVGLITTGIVVMNVFSSTVRH
jgi:small multidrug resistance pump